jgi:hypothetical protein
MIAYKSDLSELINDIHSYTHEHMNGLCKVPKPPCCWLYDIDEYALRQRPKISNNNIEPIRNCFYQVFLLPNTK